MTGNYIVIKDGPSFFRIAYRSILFVAVRRNYCVVVTSEQTFSIKCTFAEMMEGAVQQCLVQVHRSFAVNMQQVTGFNNNEVFIRCNSVPMSRGYYEAFKDQFINST